MWFALGLLLGVAAVFSTADAQTTPAPVAPGAPLPGGSLPGMPVTVLTAARVTTNAQAVPLSTFLQSVGGVSGRSVVPLGVPDTPVTIQVTAVPWGQFWKTLLLAYNLQSCEQDGVLYVGTGDAITRACGLKPIAARAYRMKLTLFEVSQDKARSLGGNLPAILGNVLAAAQSGNPAALLTADWSKAFSALESAGVATRQDEITLNTVDGQEANYRNGGSLAVNLVGSGAANIEKTLSYGLSARVTPFSLAGEAVNVHYTLDVSTPINVSTPNLLQLATRTLNGVVNLRPGESVAVVSTSSNRADTSGSGVPGVAAVPGAGFLAGSGSDTAGRGLFVVLVGVE